MYIFKETESSTNYWHETNHQNMKLEGSCINGNVMMARNDDSPPPADGLHSPQQEDMCCKSENLYQYCDRNFNFSALANMNNAGGIASEDDDAFNAFHHKRKLTTVTRDPMSHRIIEKRRRDRMNNCLADLSRLIPAEYLKKGRGRIEKTEIIEMAIKHMKYLQSRVYSNIEKIDLHKSVHHHQQQQQHNSSSENIPQQQYLGESGGQLNQTYDLVFKEAYKHGFQECVSQVTHYLIESEGYYGQKMCDNLINHLESHCNKILKDEQQPISPNRSDVVSSSSTLSMMAGCDSKISIDMNLPAAAQHQLHSESDDIGNKTQPVRMGIIIRPSSTRKYNNDDSSCEHSFPTNQAKHHNEDDSGSELGDHTNNDCNNSNSSQLREILTGPSPQISSSLTPQARPNIIRKLPLESPPVAAHRNNNSSNNNNNNNNVTVAVQHEQSMMAGNSLYKFKNNIKERFSAEHSTTMNNVMEDMGDICVSKKRRLSTTDDSSSVQSDQTSNTDTAPSPMPTTKSFTHHAQIPIFAYHSKGAFYVPMAVDSDLIDPFMNEFNNNNNGDLNINNTFSSLVIHPVTIPVNYATPMIQSIKSYDSVLSVRGIESAW